jgi:hypothetical protein
VDVLSTVKLGGMLIIVPFVEVNEIVVPAGITLPFTSTTLMLNATGVLLNATPSVQ